MPTAVPKTCLPRVSRVLCMALPVPRSSACRRSVQLNRMRFSRIILLDFGGYEAYNQRIPRGDFPIHESGYRSSYDKSRNCRRHGIWRA